MQDRIDRLVAMVQNMIRIHGITPGLAIAKVATDNNVDGTIIAKEMNRRKQIVRASRNGEAKKRYQSTVPNWRKQYDADH
jgi:hypothetical protein